MAGKAAVLPLVLITRLSSLPSLGQDQPQAQQPQANSSPAAGSQTAATSSQSATLDNQLAAGDEDDPPPSPAI